VVAVGIGAGQGGHVDAEHGLGGGHVDVDAGHEGPPQRPVATDLGQHPQLGLGQVGVDEHPAPVRRRTWGFIRGVRFWALGLRLARRPVLVPTTWRYSG
jgi:hypothetical protein